MAKRKKARKRKTTRSEGRRTRATEWLRDAGATSLEFVSGGTRAAELLRDAGVISLGFVSLTKDTRGRISRDSYSVSKCKTKGKKMEKKLLDMARKGRKEIYSVIKKQTATALDEFDIATKDDLRDLERRVRESRRRRSTPRRKASPSTSPAEINIPRS